VDETRKVCMSRKRWRRIPPIHQRRSMMPRGGQSRQCQEKRGSHEMPKKSSHRPMGALATQRRQSNEQRDQYSQARMKIQGTWKTPKTRTGVSSDQRPVIFELQGTR